MSSVAPRVIRRLWTGIIVLVFASCGKEKGTEPPSIVAIRITGKLSVELAQDTRLGAVALDAAGKVIAGIAFDWRSSDIVKATVSDGVVHGRFPGQVTITAAARGVEQSTNVVVTTISDWTTVTEDWTTYQGTAAHTGYVPATLDTGFFRFLWTQEVGPAMDLAAGDGLVFIVKSSFTAPITRELQARSARDGMLRWSKDFGALTVGAPAYWNSRVYVMTGGQTNSYLVALAAENGTQLFKTPYANQSFVWRAPVIGGGGVFTGGGTHGGVYRFDAVTGDSTYFWQLIQEDGWTPALRDGLLFVFGAPGNPSGNGLAALNEATGQVEYEITDGELPRSGTPIVVNSGIALSAELGGVSAIDLTNRRVAWKLNLIYQSNAVVSPDMFYITAGDQIRAHRLSDGVASWSWTPDGTASGNMIVTKNLLFLSAAKTYALLRSSGTLAWSYPATGRLAMTKDGLLLIASANGWLTAIKLRE